MPNLQELRESREKAKGELTKLQKSLQERRSAGKTGSELWPEADQKSFDTNRAEIARLDKEIEGEQRSLELETFLNTSNEQRGQQQGTNGQPNPKLGDEIPGGYGAEFGEVFRDRGAAQQAQIAERRSALAFHAWACGDRYNDCLTDDHHKALSELKVSASPSRISFKGLSNSEFRSLRMILGANPDAESRRQGFLHLERRALGFAANSAIIPKTLLNSFELMFSGMNGVLSLCDVMISDSTDSITHPGGNDLAEGRQYNEGDADIGDGADVELLSPTLNTFLFDSEFAKIHKQLLRNSPFDLAELMGRILAQRCYRAIDRKVIEGVRPNSFGGIVSRAALGKQMASKSAIAYAEFKNLKFSVISDYRANGTFTFHDETLAALSALVDTTGRDLLDLENNRFLNRPFLVSNYFKTPTQVAAGTTGLTLAAFGDFSMIKVRIVQDTSIERFNEKFAEKHQAAFLATKQADADMMRASTDSNCPVKLLKAPTG